jgi:hypothetical protein
MRLFLVGLLVAGLAACAARVTKLDSGETQLGERLVVDLRGPWTQVSLPGQQPRWTIEGLPLDMLLIYPGLKDGEAINKLPAGSQAKPFSFRSTMQPDEIVAMFEGALSQGGSTFTLTKLEPYAFAGGKGLRFQYSLLRKADNLNLSGVGFAGVDNGELFALLYQAPRLEFFPRHQAKVEYIARSARFSKAALPAQPATAGVAAQPDKPKPQPERPCITTLECRERGQAFTR